MATDEHASQSEKLAQQVEREFAAIQSAPPLVPASPRGRCSFCGGVATRLTLVEVLEHPLMGPVSRYKGECCDGR